MAGGPPKGELWLHSDARPALSAGDYTLELRQRIHQGDPNAALGDDKVVRKVRVSSPRFTLPGTEIHSVFPPPNADGSFQDRLAQIVLKRKTLPWERAADDAPVATRKPWLALVLLADGEANFKSGVDLADAMPAEVRSKLGVKESGTCDRLEVSDKVMAEVFPYRDELDLLCHVREVNMEDTEFAGSDDDGFLSVVVSNRLPQAGQRYAAYLISLEGQLDALPDRPPQQPAEIVEATLVYDTSPQVLLAASFAQTGSAMELTATEQPASKMTRMMEPSPWQVPSSKTTIDSGEPVAQAEPGKAFIRHDTDFGALHMALKEPPPQLFRFPVLAHWSFSCSEEPGFQRLAETIDVGLLGKQRAAKAGDPPAAPLAVADTGHTVVDRVTRRGERGEAWYRGAFTPREVKRRPAAGEGETDPRARGPYHAADQALRLANDGREDISEAAAFELGRMLALADPVFTAALAAWRRAGLAVRRLAKAATQVPGVSEIEQVDGRLTRGVASALVTKVSTPVAAQAPTRAARNVPATHVAAAKRRRPLGPVVQANDLDGMLTEADSATIADGLGLDKDVVDDVLSPGVTQAPLPRDTTEPRLPIEFDKVAAHKETLVHLERKRELLRAQVQAEADGTAPVGPRREAEPDDDRGEGDA